jgi:predicted metal-dependent hydrolase
VEAAERRATFRAACELFDGGRYLAAHELFEELWEDTHGPDADFYKGLLQAAVALHHLESGNHEGAARLYTGHRRLLAPYLPAHGGVDLAVLLAAMQRVVGPSAAGERPTWDAAARPRIGPLTA